MSSRTLNRKLSALGTNYSQLLETVRHELAEQYVADPSLSLSEISFLLGFSEQSAFSRAFKRWNGRSPSAFRESAA
jgi:AraC-like DNA-binding protein